MGSFWKLPECIEAPTGVGIAGFGRITVEEYEQALADNDTAQLAIWDAALAGIGAAYYEDTPTEWIIPDPEDE